ncbi:hypothetical protein LOK46_13380 [Methylobacterium sp. NMS14P]|uniref:hypothetical protein n=1 Tax=Methylobacterium sp. NMS14P TaxID=2894310 RepID=UPI002359FFA1|nr:hypothetical protein [Methylobacterium sp. NMS14P]WCS27766.1 hypothetical protein LOK46_13380 [Methylobacterium sp. NMS14P]
MMPEPTLGGFAPFNEAHAIVSVQATIQFGHPVSEGQWAAMRPAIWALGRDLDIGQPSPAFGLAVNFNGTQLGVALNSPAVSSQQIMGLNFSLVDADDRVTERISINKDSIQIQSNQYVRWRPFIGRIESVLSRINKYYVFEAPPFFIQLEYWDRFDLVEARVLDATKLISAEAPWVASAGSSSIEPWHSHAGHFERLSDKIRRLYQTKIDFADFPGKEGRQTRSFIIYTMTQDMVNAPGYGRTIGRGWEVPVVLDALNQQHAALKDELRRIITPEAAERIGL